jgi:hypothetical protein
MNDRADTSLYQPRRQPRQSRDRRRRSPREVKVLLYHVGLVLWAMRRAEREEGGDR